MEIAERCAYYGMSTNFITYLTGPLGESTASAAASVNTWSGVSSMVPLLGGLLADSFVGRYRTIVIASVVYVLGLGMLTETAVSPYLRPLCGGNDDTEACHPTQFQSAIFFLAIYLVSFAQGRTSPNDPEEFRSRSSFFNWWYFGMHSGLIFTFVFMNYVQQEISWGFGFGVSCASMALGLALFLIGTPNYRHSILNNKGPVASLAQSSAKEVNEVSEALLPEATSQSSNDKSHSQTAREVLRLFPIWASCLMYAVHHGQTNRPHLQPPPATLQSFVSLSVVIFVPIYDRILVPIARAFTGIPSGLTMLQRIGVGMLISLASMAVAALVEMKRLRTARDFGLIDLPNATIPMSLWWLVPQYVLSGISDSFTMVGLQEFFYDQVPDGLRSLGIALYLSIFGMGSFISSFIISVIDRASRTSGNSWFSDNLNRGHLDYFYGFLAVLSAVALTIFLYLAQIYQYKSKVKDRI
ncbi:unnamed protein product [Spirodela intermedia]|uniref:Uncharacterized protein n=1 Tax=Spirodela intermedia TaxID=51605 RepID=A0A7I8IRS4_SPIIN|nr:unnamed protein product [Spirodela intermedia]CAA6660485.1 unnamed protein product [Spirodela intermedia]